MDWHARLTDRVLREAHDFPGDHQRVDRIVDYLHRGMRGFQRYPSYADLLVYVAASRDPHASQALDEMSVRTNRVLRLFLGPGLAPDPFETLSFVSGPSGSTRFCAGAPGATP